MAIQYYTDSSDLSLVVRYQGQVLSEDKKTVVPVTKEVFLRVSDLGHKSREKYEESGKITRVQVIEDGIKYDAIDPEYFWYALNIDSDIKFESPPDSDAPDVLDCFLIGATALRNKDKSLKDALPPKGKVDDLIKVYTRKGMPQKEAYEKACAELTVYQTKTPGIYIKKDVPDGTENSYPDSYIELSGPEETVTVLKPEVKKVKVSK